MLFRNNNGVEKDKKNIETVKELYM